jgi:hypothetical protein
MEVQRMLVNAFKKAVWISTVAIALAVSTAWAAPRNSALVGGSKEDKNSEYTKILPGGLEVTYKGVWKHENKLEVFYSVIATRDMRLSVEYNNSTLKDTNDIVIHWNLSSTPQQIWDREKYFEREQTIANISHVNAPGRPKRQRKDLTFSPDAIREAEAKKKIAPGVYIDDKEQKEYTEITANQPYKVMIRYWVPADYLLTPTLASVVISVNGLPIEFKDVSIAP